MAISRNGLLITDKILDSGHGAEISILVFIFTVTHTDPVSYTHLDVYKRQSPDVRAVLI